VEVLSVLFCVKTERGSKLPAEPQADHRPKTEITTAVGDIFAITADCQQNSVDDRVSTATLSASSQQEQQHQRQQTRHSKMANWPLSLIVADPRQQQQKRSQTQMEHQQNSHIVA
jgi:hypothetical protein